MWAATAGGHLAAVIAQYAPYLPAVLAPWDKLLQAAGAAAALTITRLCQSQAGSNGPLPVASHRTCSPATRTSRPQAPLPGSIFTCGREGRHLNVIGLSGTSRTPPCLRTCAGAAWGACLDNQVVLAATCAASLKLVLICTGVGWLLRTGRIPNDTAPVLSKARAICLSSSAPSRSVTLLAMHIC